MTNNAGTIEVAKTGKIATNEETGIITEMCDGASMVTNYGKIGSIKNDNIQINAATGSIDVMYVDGIVQNNYGRIGTMNSGTKVDVNYGTIEAACDGSKISSAQAGSTVGTVASGAEFASINYGTIGTCNVSLTSNYGTIGTLASGTTLTNNYGTVGVNKGRIEYNSNLKNVPALIKTNQGTVFNNTATINLNQGVVYLHISGTIYHNPKGGTITTQYYGAKVANLKWHSTVTDAAVAVTCTTDGKTAGSHCSVCG